MLTETFLKMLKIVKTCENPYVEGFVGPWGFFFFLNVKKLWELCENLYLEGFVGPRKSIFFSTYELWYPNPQEKDKN